MASSETEVAERAKRRDAAIEKNKEAFLKMALEYEENVDKLNHFHKVWHGINSGLDLLQDLLLGRDLANSNETRAYFEEKLNDLLFKLKRDSFDPEMNDLFNSINSSAYAWDNILIWLEIDSERVQERIEHLAYVVNIPYDKNEKLWMQKILEKNEETQEHRGESEIKWRS